MLKLRKIAVTGGIASGKSSVCQIFKELGAFTVDADAVVHKLLDPASSLGKKIAHDLHLDVSSSTPQIFRKQIADKVFKSEERLQKLEALLHPIVNKTIESLYETACKEDKWTCFIVEVPLLFESKADSFYDGIITVISDPFLAERRFLSQGFSKEDYALRMKRQWKVEEKAKQSNWVIQNEGSLEDLKKQVIKIYQTLQEL